MWLGFEMRSFRIGDVPGFISWGDERDAKVLEVPLIRRDNRQAVHHCRRRDCCIFEVRGVSRGDHAVEHATGLDRLAETKLERPGLIKFDDTIQPTG